MPAHITNKEGRPKAITEAEFTYQIIELARLRGWRTAHFRPGRTMQGWRTSVQGDGKGFPDLVLIRGKTILIRELKRSRKEKLTEEQEMWLEAFRAACIPVGVWTPEDWCEIENVLT